MTEFLRRDTQLPFLLEFLHTKELVLLSPISWEDKNDSFYLEKYAEMKGLSAVFALCLTECGETYHHWKVFSSGSSGMCIQFDKNQLLQWAKSNPSLRAEPVKYKTLKEMSSTKLDCDDFPFLKRQAFQPEREFRLIAASAPETNCQFTSLRLSIPLSIVDRIVMNPWMPEAVAKHVKATIQGLEGCERLKVYRTTLVDNKAWKKFASNME